MNLADETPSELLNYFLTLPHETEWLEFKEAKANFDFRSLGKYFSALSNEAFLKGRDDAWLVFGVRDDRSVCGSNYRINPTDLQRLKYEIASQTSGRLTFDEIHVVNHQQGRVVMFQIPAASHGMPTDSKGHWYGREGESLVPLSLRKLLKIVSGSSELTDLDRFETHLSDCDNWRYDGQGTAVYLPDANFVIRIEKAEEGYGAGNYWWGNILERPTALSYRFISKGQEIDSSLVLLYRNERLTIPFPQMEFVTHNFVDDPSLQTDYYGDLVYYDRDSPEYRLLCHIRATEGGRGSQVEPSTPIESQIKPPIIRLPFPILGSQAELDALLDKVRLKLPGFNSRHATEIASITPADVEQRMKVERLFSWWVYDLWKNG